MSKITNQQTKSHKAEVSCDCGHSHGHEGKNALQIYIPLAISFFLLAIGILLDYQIIPNLFFQGVTRFVWYLAAFVPVSFPVIKNAIKAISERDIFNEFTLMTVATVGAFCIKEYPEGVAVMLFYSVGELFQDRAVQKARGNIKSLIDMRVSVAMTLRNGAFVEVNPDDVNIGDTIQVRVGEKVPLDGKLIASSSSFDTSALTGESKPVSYKEGEVVLAGMVNLAKVVEIKVEKKYSDSSLSRILEMVEDATSRKAKTELLIRRFARIYTPIVFLLALLVTVVPYFIVSDYVFEDWLYKALVFLVISCPCALVISVPLGYFGGIGAASRQGILFKGANYLDIMAKVNTVVMDKTGTLTKGVFKVQSVVAKNVDETKLIQVAKAIESQSTHPIAKAISEYKGDISITSLEVKDVEEIAGHGLKGVVNGEVVLAGNSKLLKKFDVDYDKEIDSIVSSIVVLAIDHKYAGYITIADEVKEDSAELIKKLHQQGAKSVMLSGDKDSIVEQTAKELGIDVAYGGLLPQDKLKHMETLKLEEANVVAFLGDGINDTPVLALSDVGIAMGAMGSDAAIEVADVVIQTDQPSKVLTAMQISKKTKRIVMQNITLAIGIKILVMALSTVGLATMWEAVFADVGVTMIAILNSIRILKKKF